MDCSLTQQSAPTQPKRHLFLQLLLQTLSPEIRSTLPYFTSILVPIIILSKVTKKKNNLLLSSFPHSISFDFAQKKQTWKQRSELDVPEQHNHRPQFKFSSQHIQHIHLYFQHRIPASLRHLLGLCFPARSLPAHRFPHPCPTGYPCQYLGLWTRRGASYAWNNSLFQY